MHKLPRGLSIPRNPSSPQSGPNVDGHQKAGCQLYISTQHADFSIGMKGWTFLNGKINKYIYTDTETEIGDVNQALINN